jgi:hypothetical protein
MDALTASVWPRTWYGAVSVLRMREMTISISPGSSDAA